MIDKEKHQVFIKVTNKKHKGTGWNRFKVTQGDFTTDTPDLITLNLGNANSINFEIVDGEISMWTRDFEFELLQPVYDTAIIDLKRKNK